MRQRSARLTLSAAVLATAALALTACTSNGSSDSASSPAAQVSSASGTSTGTPSDSGSTPVTSGASPSSTGSGSGSATSGGSSVQAKSGTGASSVPACASSRLAVSREDDSVGAGQFYTKIVFTNTGSGSCTLTGFPGVSYVAANGVQSGNPATRTNESVSTVTLPSHGTATATLHDSDGQGGYSAGQCRLASVQGLRIYPPNQKAALFLPFRTKHCSGTSIDPLSVAPVRR